jgi:protein-disulfide isomerase
MQLKLKWITLPLLILFLSPMQVYASNQMEPPGIILGGSLDSPIRIEIFSNFGCSACREYYLRTIKKILKEYSSADKVCVIYHDFPFRYHKYDREAARYVEAASRISRETLLQVMDALYRDQLTWSENGKLQETIAKALPKNIFEELMQMSKDPKIDPLIEAQYELAVKNKLESTPTSFIFYTGKEQKIEGLLTFIVLKTFIDKILH